MEEKYQEIDLMELMKAVLKKWWLLAGLFIIGVMSANYYSTNFTIPYYQAEATVFMGKEPSDEESKAISVATFQLTGQLVNDYEQMLKTRQVAETVIKKMNLDMSVGAFTSSLYITPVAESRFAMVGFTHYDPQIAADVANELSKQLSVVAQQIVGYDNISIIDQAVVPTYPIGQGTLMNAAIAGLIGLIIGFLIIIVQILMNNTVKKEEEIEKLFELPVLAAIPMLKGEVKEHA